MLLSLLAKYQAVVQEFRLGRHALTDTSLQTVVEQCNNYDKDVRVRLVKMASLHALLLPTPLGLTPKTSTRLCLASLSITTSANGRRPLSTRKGNAWCALTRHATPTTKRAIVPS